MFNLYEGKKEKFIGTFPTFKEAKKIADNELGTYIVPINETEWHLCNTGFVEFVIVQETETF